MHKKILFLFAGLMMIMQLCSADDIGVVFTFPDDTAIGRCVHVTKNTDGYEVLKSTNLDFAFAGPTSFGHQLCMVNGIGDDVIGSACAYSGSYWGFYIARNNDFSYMPVGFDGGNTCWNKDENSYVGHYCAKQGDVLGFRYGEFGDKPAFYSFDSLCKPLLLQEVKAYVDGREVPLNNIKANLNSTVKFKIVAGNEYQFDDALSIQDVEAELESDSLDIAEKKYFKELYSGKSDSVTIEFRIPSVLDDKYPQIKLKIAGVTSTGISQEISELYEIKIVEKIQPSIVNENITLPLEENNSIKTVMAAENKIVQQPVKKITPKKDTFARLGPILMLAFFEVLVLIMIVMIMLVLRR